MINNLCKKVILAGGSLTPLIIDPKTTNGTGLMNPSILLDKGKLLLNLRHVNYTLYHCENGQLFNNRWGPLSYLNPEDDLHLRTWNYMCELNEDLTIRKLQLIDTSTLDVPPIWEFVGLEDGRLVRWEEKLYLCGVRRDTTTNGQGRMELSEIARKDGKWQELARYRIEPPDTTSYCEKNWMPILDMPYHFVKWSNPTEMVKVDIKTLKAKTIVWKGGVGPFQNMRGGSQVIPFGEFRICIIHEVDLLKNKLNQKDAKYTHRFVMWDKDWNIVHVSDMFSFMTGEVEFCCGMTMHENHLLITFGFQDNAAYILRMPVKFFCDMMGIERTKDVDIEEPLFNWGEIKENTWIKNKFEDEIFEDKVYEKHFQVEIDDLVLDIGASVGPFTYSILDKKPKKVYCLEPHPELFKTLSDNIGLNNNVTLINKGVANTDGDNMLPGMFNKDSINYLSKPQIVPTITFESFIKEFGVSEIDFLKTDCEGGEYSIFTPKNKAWIKIHVHKIAGEFHLYNESLKKEFIAFRDSYLKTFLNYKVEDMMGNDITDTIYSDSFINNTMECMIYIDNRRKGFPIINWITLLDSKERQERMLDQFHRFGMSDHMIAAFDGRHQDFKNTSFVTGSFFDKMNSGEIATTCSHLLAIKLWYEMSEDDYGFFCEDDITFETINYWNKSWDDFIKDLPKGWKAIQLSLIKDDPLTEENMKFHIREWNDWSVGVYILSREYARKIIDKYIIDGKYVLSNGVIIPFPETIILENEEENENIYSIPLFTENNTDFESSFYPQFISTPYKGLQKECSDFILHWWKNKAIPKSTGNNGWKTTTYPTLEITTNIRQPKGCTIGCTVCPQDKLMTNYKGQSTLTLLNFMRVIDKLPKEVRITFSGFAEPFLNNMCTEMILYAHEKGHPISVYTTGVGLTLAKMRLLKDIPYSMGPNGGFCLHLPDTEGKTPIKLTPQYLNTIEYISSIQKEIQGFNAVCMGPVPDLLPPFQNIGVLTIYNRAGNLERKVSINNSFPCTCRCIEGVYHNVLLPNGDVVLCCMDYSLQHPLGNLFEQEYDDIVPIPNEVFELCKYCENGIDVIKNDKI